MRTRARATLAILLAVGGAACASSAREGGQGTLLDPRLQTTAAPASPGAAVPMTDGAADTGCVDEPGTVEAAAAGWYPGSADGVLALNGDRSRSVTLDRFGVAAARLVAGPAPAFDLEQTFEMRRPDAGCATHRYAVFAREQERIVVSVWRVESAADPYWVPNESPFTAVADDTLVSIGDHIDAVLVVAPDGTTARASSYGAGVADRVAGWPTTAAPPPSAAPLGTAPVGTDDLRTVARAVLDLVLGQR